MHMVNDTPLSMKQVAFPGRNLRTYFNQCVVININRLCFQFSLEAFSQVISFFGQLDIVCNNAGVIDEDDLHKTLNVNLVR